MNDMEQIQIDQQIQLNQELRKLLEAIRELGKVQVEVVEAASSLQKVIATL